MPDFHVWPGYIIRKTFFLSGLFLAAALIFWIKADTDPTLYPALRHFIQYSQSSSAMVLAAGLVGGLLLENGLRQLGH